MNIHDLKNIAMTVSNRSLNSDDGRNSPEDIVSDALFDFNELQKAILRRISKETLTSWRDDNLNTNPEHYVLHDLLLRKVRD